MKNKNALLECTNCGKSLGPKTQSHLENQDNGDQRWSCNKPQTKTRCDGKTHYIPTSERNSVIGVCDCKPKTHTPTPLHIEKNNRGQCFIRNESGYTVAIIETSGLSGNPDEENAAFIALAVNAHEDLILSLKRMVSDGDSNAKAEALRVIAKAEGK